jgi:hypothetical protein
MPSLPSSSATYAAARAELIAALAKLARRGCLIAHSTHCGSRRIGRRSGQLTQLGHHGVGILGAEN